MSADIGRANQKNKDKNQLTMFKSNWSHKNVDGIIVITDHNGPKSVTNDMDNVLASLFEQYLNLASCKVIYCDSQGEWDRVIVKSASSIGIDWSFAPITPGKRITNEQEAIEAIKRTL